MVTRYTEIEQPNTGYEWGMKEDACGKWVKYDDIEHYIEKCNEIDRVNEEKNSDNKFMLLVLMILIYFIFGVLLYYSI
jgi:predicted nucleic acid-binding Zn ribbon protein